MASLGEPQILAPLKEAARPTQSPDGKVLVLSAGAEGERSLYRVGVDGSGLKRITQDKGDDRDPSFNQDGSKLFWSSNREGSFDLFMMPWKKGQPAGPPQRLTDLPGDEVEPNASPLLYELQAVIDDECSGPSGRRVSLYEKIAFTRLYEGRSEVWFSSIKGRHRGRISPEGQRCRRPIYSYDGLSLLWTCGEDELQDTRARWERSFSDALQLLKGEGCERAGRSKKAWREDPCHKRLPRRYAQHPVQWRAQGYQGAGYSLNGILTLGEKEGQLYQKRRLAQAPWGALQAGRDPLWSPRGSKLFFVDEQGLHKAKTDFYLQSVKNLYDYPEFWREFRSPKLHKQHFVALPGQEKEFSSLYEKISYAKRGPFVTADAALQVFHDEFSSLLQEAEARVMEDLQLLSEAQAAYWQKRLHRGRSSRYLALYFSVPSLLLKALSDLKQPESFPGEDPPAAVSVSARLKERIPALLKTQPKRLRAEIAEHLKAIQSHAGIKELRVPGMAEVKVDFSLFQIRGHYSGSKLAGYFLAMQWFSLLPLPMDRSVLEMARRFDDPKLLNHWKAVDELGGAFLGRPVDPSLAHLRALYKKRPKLFSPWQSKKINAALKRAIGPIPLRGLGGAKGEKRRAHLRLFPKRLGLDAAFFSALTSPTLMTSSCARRWPLPEEVFAVLGNSRAQEIALESFKGEPQAEKCEARRWQERYQTALEAQIGKYKEGLPQTDLYHSWLALLETLAEQGGEGRRLKFVRSSAWKDRRLFSALAGFTQLKHDSVLYAAQEYGVECGGDISVKGYLERPILPEPPAFVDPMPRFFGQLEALAIEVHRRIGASKEPKIKLPWEEEGILMNARRFAARLKEMATREVEGKALSREDQAWLRKVGPLMEAMLIGQEKTYNTYIGKNQGRMERGVTLVSDIYTQLSLGQVLQIGLGHLMDLFVVIPDGYAHNLVQGGIQSYRAFHHPLEDRLTDEAWYERLKAGKAPPLPPWTESFISQKLLSW